MKLRYYTIVDGIKGKGQFVGVYLAWGVNNNGWWGEGEIKFLSGWRYKVSDHLRNRN